MNIFAQFSLIFAVYIAGECIASILPFTFPASIISLILMYGLLSTKLIKVHQLNEAVNFVLINMGIIFLPPIAGVINYSDLIKSSFVSFIVISIVSSLLAFFATGWTAQLIIRFREKRG
ncbi:hypothetical protein AN639_04430 [Candidatus Epulonipiscium fishelsonii]|uniref:Uncharacterized protein n=1 Tax=Candidatus Epulonipiscium fishelsonii TaxID=77094 RepID=A0ACC8X8U1_9FIRM|nr:hypothetical protein AN396_11120 [Epulopiscium sp. SCG-B11WGA-EpuloA1]ONI40540.1 hypothetical protein AN639_04430 [Epulopiscium sp. SCG-B05WGA-EpuloA1]